MRTVSGEGKRMRKMLFFVRNEHDCLLPYDAADRAHSPTDFRWPPVAKSGQGTRLLSEVSRVRVPPGGPVFFCGVAQRKSEGLISLW